MDVYVGDRVQIVNGGIDVTNGNRAIAGRKYGEGGPLWAVVESITNGWNTGSRWGLPSKVTKVRCSNNGVVVWQVQPQHIANGTIRSSEPDTIQTKPADPPAPPPKSNEDTKEDSTVTTYVGTDNSYISTMAYAIGKDAEVWSEDGGFGTSTQTSDGQVPTVDLETQITSDRAVFGVPQDFTYPKSTGTWRDLNSKERASIGTSSLKVDQSVLDGFSTKTSWQIPERRRQLLNEDVENIVNPLAFPKRAEGAQGLIAAKYNYQIIPGDPVFPTMISLEDKLQEVRASLGIQVHGNNMIAKASKYFMYNRFKVPDTNLAHNKSITHVFFTRPDLNILTLEGDANSQTKNNSETAMVWRRHPELFKLLTDCSRCGDSNNFNFLLSNQVTSFEIQDETLTQNKAGKSWNEYEMPYGDAYSARTAGEFSCNFMETSDYSIINLVKLWITYIDLVAKGAWSPSYDLLGDGMGNIGSSHVYSKSLDYAASAYVFKCGPDGEDVLYWSKYYGIYPLNTGASALSWDLNNPVGDAPRLNIRFGYCYKRDMSPISLIEFNRAAGISGEKDAISENSFNVELGHSSRPFVGPPFIEIKLGETRLKDNGVDASRSRTEIRLKFKKDSGAELSDSLLYRYSMGNRTT